MVSTPLLVIGGGAAGIIAAWRAASVGAKVVLLERNTKLGVKLLISGGGKCNITHAGAMEDVRSAFRPREARFLKPSFYRFSNEDVITMIEARGVKTYTRSNGRIFPVKGDADDVVKALADYLRISAVDVQQNARVTGIVCSDGEVVGVKLKEGTVESSCIILATGGSSYPKTGTTGDGFGWAKELGHTIVPTRAALAPIGVKPKWPAEWRGIAIRGGCLTVLSNGKKVCECHDDILFSHEGISGPAALDVSRAAAEAMVGSTTHLSFDFFPKKDFKTLDRQLNSFVLAQRGKEIATLLGSWLPNRIVPALLRFAGVDQNKRGHTLTREERKTIVNLLKSWNLGEVSSITIERGEVTAGGVSLDDVDPHTMRSRKTKGLYICGEVLDIAGPVGGYNLQAAFSTGFVAGESAGQAWLSANP